MYTTDPHHALGLAHERARLLREEAAAERPRRAARTLCPLRALLQRWADRRRTPPRLAGRPAEQL